MVSAQEILSVTINTDIIREFELPSSFEESVDEIGMMKEIGNSKCGPKTQHYF